MSDYRRIAEEALRKANLSKELKKKALNEGVLYPDGLTERMHPELENDLRERKHSLGKHEIFPEGDEHMFEEKIMGERFKEVANRYKRAFEVDEIDNNKLMREMMPLLSETMSLESSHKKELEELAEKIIREEYDMGEDVVEIIAELTPSISIEGTKKNPKPVSSKIQFENHESMSGANKEVYKRRFINAMIQGAAKKCNHMFHMFDDELSDIDPKLANKYSKLMSAADYMYFVIPKMDNGVNGGVVRVQFPTADNPKAVIHAQAMAFPVLIHELVKGVMELMSAHALPKDKEVAQYVIDKADFLAAEPWDMRLGPALWSRFTECIEPNDFNLKHHIYTEMITLPTDEFNHKMREVMACTKEGKNIIKEIASKIKSEFQEDEFNEAMNQLEEKDKIYHDNASSSFDFEDLMGESDDDDSDDGNTWDFEDLF
jgi:hypothetical protein